jgi:DNA polymerase elongation subunit (family B)
MFSDCSYIDAAETKESVVVWGRDFDGNLFKEELPVSDYLYCFTPSNSTKDTGYKDIYGTPLKKINFESKWDMREYTKDRDNLCESDVLPTYKALLDNFSESPQTAPMNAWYFDIEADFDLSDGRGYPIPSNPFAPINFFQFYDTGSDQYYLINYKRCATPKDPDGRVVNQITLDSERDILLKVADLLEELSCDVMLAWNGNGFDLPYIMARATICFGERYAKKMFCRDGFSAVSREYVDEYGNDAVGWKLVGRQHVDMLEVYKKFIPSEKKSFSLSNVCMEDLGEDKEDYDGDLGQLYRESPDKFAMYAFKDVRLLKMLDDKHQMLKLATSIARGSCIKLSDITGSVKVIEHDFMRFCHKKGIRLPDRSHNEKVKYDGAVVYDCVSGVHKWVYSLDAVSLYPMCMILLGLSRETILYQCEGEYEDYIHIITRNDSFGKISLTHDRTGDVVEMYPSDVEAQIRENGWTISGNGTIFTGELGLLAEYVSEGFKLRKFYKNKMAECIKCGDDDGAALNDLYQKVIKVARLNAVYGASGNETFKLFDLRLAKSITLTAQMVSKQQAIAGNDAIKTVEKILLRGD